MDMTEQTDRPRTKAEWRRYLLEQRRAQPAELHIAEAELLAAGAVAAAVTRAGPEPETMPGTPHAASGRVPDTAPHTASGRRPDTAPDTTSDTTPTTTPGTVPDTSPGTAPDTSPGTTTDGNTAQSTVCCYAPIRHEPGSLAMLDALREAGLRVLLPIVPSADDADQSVIALNWALYQGPSSLVAGPFGLRQPAGPGLGPHAIASARLVLIPALAVDRRGVRLGRGAGWYDRTLPLARPGAALVAVVRDTEVVDALPADEHDVLMTGVLTPRLGPRALPLG